MEGFAKKVKNFLLLSLYWLCLFGSFLPLSAQIGAHPNTVKWQQINANQLKVIFPKGFEKQAFRVVNIINHINSNNTRSIGERQLPLQILVHNQTTIPNGFVGVSPFRSEFFATPPQSANTLGTLDWLDALTIHEYRHAQQYANSKVGLSKIASYLMGENGWGLAVSAIPNWFWEGDAVFIETALSSQGRGRSPFFTATQRALLLNNRTYSYQKARNGSFKDLLPNHYPLGYLMNDYARRQFGNDVWKSVFEDAARYRSILYPFSKALKKKVGLSTKQLYEMAYQEAQNRWKEEQQSMVLSATNRRSFIPTKIVTSYRFPFYLEDGSLAYIKNSYQKTAELYQLKDGTERRLSTIGFSLEPYLSVTKNKAIWTEYEQDPRRTKRNYSTLVVYDFNTNQKRRLTKKSRFFSPAFSYSGTQIITVQVTPEQQNTFVVLEAATGNAIQTLPNPENYFLSFPKWLENDSGIVFIAKHNSQLAIFKYQIKEGVSQQLTNWTHHNISDLFIKNKQIYFTASFSGIDNIYTIPLEQGSSQRSKELFSNALQQLSSVSIGAYQPSISLDGSELIFSEFSDMGYFLADLPLPERAKKQLVTTTIEPDLQQNYPINFHSEEEGDILDNVPQIEYNITPYSGMLKGLKLHSWNLTPNVATPSLDIQVNNILNDFSMNLLGGYNLNERSPFYSLSATYSKWYPEIRLFAGVSKRATDFLSTTDTLARQQFDQHSLGSTVSLPLSWNKGNFSTSITPFVSYAQRFIRNAVFEKKEQANFSLGTLALGIELSNLRRTAYQNVDTRLGQKVSLAYFQTIDGRRNQKAGITNTLFFPGIGANHSIKLEAAYQKELLKNQYQFSDNFDYPRGYNAPVNDAFTRLSFNYQLPLAYPDWGFGGITYFRRIRANLFFDYGKSRIDFKAIQTKYQSAGVEVLFDNHFFMELPVTIGLRNSYLFNKDPFYPNKKYQFGFFIRSEFF